MGLYDIEPSGAPHSLLDERPQLPYLIPMLAFGLIMAGTALDHFFGVDFPALWHTYHPAVYATKTVVAAILLGVFWKHYTKIRWTHLGLGFFLGVVGVFQWVGTEYGMQWLLLHTPLAALHWFKPLADADLTYIPTKEIADPRLRALFYLIRIAGPTLVVPVMEELFWRDFMMRALIRGARFQEVAIGTFTWISFVGTTLLFSAIHFQRVAAVIWAIMIGALLIRTKSIGACIVMHATTNLLLGLYVLHTGDWQFW